MKCMGQCNWYHNPCVQHLGFFFVFPDLTLISVVIVEQSNCYGPVLKKKEAGSKFFVYFLSVHMIGSSRLTQTLLLRLKHIYNV